MVTKVIEIGLDQVIADAIKGDKAALDDLRFSQWFTTQLDQISRKQAKRFGVDAEEIRDEVFDKLSDKIQDISNPNNRPLAQCLLGYCRQIAVRFCLNIIRSNGVKSDYADGLTARERANGTRKSSGGLKKPIQSSGANSPDEILLKLKIAMLAQQIRDGVYLKLKHELDNSSPKDLRIVICWAAGMMTLTQISAATGIPVATVQRRLVAWQKSILEKTILQRIIDKHPQERASAYEIIQNGVKELCRAA